ncbi:hypothetical protein K7G98_41635, partial [Saccharothrix sp. MB29]|nr:hypothetical protein [Saccharothrix sp. MB29]
VVLSGHSDAVARMAESLSARGHRTTSLPMAFAFHSALVEPMLAEFAEVCRGLDYQPPTLPVVSTLTGKPVSAELCSPDHWVRQ